MAIDNAEKRRSAGGVAYLPLIPGVTPNVTRDAEWRAQSAWSYAGISVAPPTVISGCFIASNPIPEISGYYYVLLRDYTGSVSAIFDTWRSVRIMRKLNEPDEFEFIIGAYDNRISLFVDDARLELWRSVPGVDLGWYAECVGLIVEHDLDITEEGDQIYRVNAVGGTDLIDRAEVNYQAGTVRADKSDDAETVMKEYVYQNIGAGALTTLGRFVDGVRTGVLVPASLGYGALYQEGNSGRRVLAVLQEISEFTRDQGYPLDFSLEPNGSSSWLFITYPGGRGTDRTEVGLKASTGVNAAGEVPVTFSIANGTLSRLRYRKSRRKEVNVVTVWGSGDGSTRKYRVRSDAARVASTPYNQREGSLNGSSQAFQYQLDQIGDSRLATSIPLEFLELTPLQQASQLYGKHYFLGDRVTCIEDITGVSGSLRILEVNLTLNGEDGSEAFSFKME